MPTAQSVHAPAPVEDLDLPALQLRQVDLPFSAWYVPAAHNVHEVTSPPTEKVPAMHTPHNPSAFLNWPASHGTGAQPAEPTPADEPTAQAGQEVAPAAEYVFAPQVPQLVEPAAPE